MVKFDAHLHGTLRNGGYSTAQIQEIQRRFNFERDYLAVLRDDVAKNLAPAIYTDLSTRLYNTGQTRTDVPQLVARSAYEIADALVAAR
jgi:hypothetical protein